MNYLINLRSVQVQEEFKGHQKVLEIEGFTSVLYTKKF